MTRFTHGFLVLGLMLAGLIIMQTVKQNRIGEYLQIYDSRISNGRFAAVTSGASGSSAYVGDLDGKVKWSIRGMQFLTMPYVVDRDRILFVDQNLMSKPTFSIIEVDISGEKLMCKMLLTSNKYISSPFTPEGDFSGDIMFFAGDYLPGREYNSIPVRNLFILRRGKILQPSGPAFSTIGPLAQLGDSEFLGVSSEIYPVIQTNPTQEIDTSMSGGLVMLDVSIANLVAFPAPFSVPIVGDVMSVSAFPQLGFSLLKQQEFRGNFARDVVTVIDNRTFKIINRFGTLDDRFRFGNLVEAPDGEGNHFFSIAVARQDFGEGMNFIAEIRDGYVSRLIPIDTESAASVSMTDCDVSEAVHF